MRKFVYYGSFASAAYFTDLFGIPAVAYSLRKLSPNSVYSGAAIRVRRSSDNTEQDINFVSSAVDAPLDTAALLSFVGVGNGFVTRWYDQSGNGRNVAQTSASLQPRIVLSGVVEEVNSLPSLFYINASNQRLTNNFTAISQPLTFFTISKLTAASGINASVIFDSFNNTQCILYNSGISEGLPTSLRNTYIATAGTSVRVDREILAGNTNQNFFNGIFNGTSSSYYEQNTSLLTGVDSGSNSLSGISIGNLRGNPNPLNVAYGMSGYIQEVIIYGADKLSQRTDMVNNQTAYY